jgi:hypothetical protein
MTVESWNSGEATGGRRKWLIVGLIIGVIEIGIALALGHPSLSLAGVAIGVLATFRGLSIRGKGVDPSKSTLQRLRKREFLKYGRPF